MEKNISVEKRRSSVPNQRCVCNRSKCRSFQRTFRKANHQFFNGFVEVEFTLDERSSQVVKHAWDRYLQVDRDTREIWKTEGRQVYTVAHHHFTEEMLQEFLKDKEKWNWKVPMNESFARRVLGELNPLDSLKKRSTNELGYLKVPNVPKDQVKKAAKALKMFDSTHSAMSLTASSHHNGDSFHGVSRHSLEPLDDIIEISEEGKFVVSSEKRTSTNKKKGPRLSLLSELDEMDESAEFAEEHLPDLPPAKKVTSAVSIRKKPWMEEENEASEASDINDFDSAGVVVHRSQKQAGAKDVPTADSATGHIQAIRAAGDKKSTLKKALSNRQLPLDDIAEISNDDRTRNVEATFKFSKRKSQDSLVGSTIAMTDDHTAETQIKSIELELKNLQQRLDEERTNHRQTLNELSQSQHYAQQAKDAQVAVDTARESLSEYRTIVATMTKRIEELEHEKNVQIESKAKQDSIASEMVSPDQLAHVSNLLEEAQAKLARAEQERMEEHTNAIFLQAELDQSRVERHSYEAALRTELEDEMTRNALLNSKLEALRKAVVENDDLGEAQVYEEKARVICLRERLVDALENVDEIQIVRSELQSDVLDEALTSLEFFEEEQKTHEEALGRLQKIIDTQRGHEKELMHQLKSMETEQDRDEKKIGDLEGIVKRFEERDVELIKEREAMKFKTEALQKEHEIHMEIIEQLQTSEKEQHQVSAELQAKLKLAEEEKSSYANHIEQLRSEHRAREKELQQEHQNLAAKIKISEERHQKDASTIDDLRASVARYEAHETKLVGQIQKGVSDREVSTDAISELQKKIREYQEKEIEQLGIQKALNSRTRSLETEKDECMLTIGELRETLRNKEASEIELHNKVRSLESQQEEHAETISQLKLYANKQQNELTPYAQSKVPAGTQEITRLQRSLREHEAKGKEFSKKEGALLRENKELSDKVKFFEGSNKILVNDLLELTELVKTHEETIKGLKESRADGAPSGMGDLLSTQNDIDQLIDEIGGDEVASEEKLHGSTADLQKSSDAASAKELEELTLSNLQQKDMINALELKLQAVTNELEMHQQEFQDAIRQQMDQTNSTLSVMSSRLDHMASLEKLVKEKGL